MRVAHIKMSEEVMSYDCPKCGSGGATVVGGYHNGWLPMSRREQRRARKAAKNAYMWRTFGDRPWRKCHDSLEWKSLNRPTRELRATYIGGYYLHDHHRFHIDEFRSASGFVAMSRVADGFRK